MIRAHRSVFEAAKVKTGTPNAWFPKVSTACPKFLTRDVRTPEDYCEKDPCSTRKCSCQKLANPCPTLGQLLASRVLYALLVEEKQHESARARFCTQSCSKLVNSLSTPRHLPIPVYILLSAPPKKAYFCKSIAIEMGGVPRYFFTWIGVRGRFDSPDDICSWPIRERQSGFIQLVLTVLVFWFRVLLMMPASRASSRKPQSVPLN